MENIGIDRATLEQIITQVIAAQCEKDSYSCTCGKDVFIEREESTDSLESFRKEADGVLQMAVPKIMVRPQDKLDTGVEGDCVYTRDIFSLKQSPRLGCGIMEMEKTTFDWTLDYDEIDYVIEGYVTIIKNGTWVTAGPGEVIFIPKGSRIQFSVPQKARFLYVTYPADWAGK